MTISIIIPNYNGEKLLPKNLPAVFSAAKYYEEKTKNKTEVIIVDDYSEDSSIKVLEKLHFPIKLIKNKENLGFSSSIHIGTKAAVGSILVLLNSDVAPQEDFLLPLIEHFENEMIFGVGCMDKSIEGEKVILRGRGVGSWKRGFLAHARGEVDKVNTLWVNGGSGAFRKSIWETLGGFDQIYNPFYWEDIDLSYRAQKAGYSCLFESGSVVIHRHEEGAIVKKYSSWQIKTIAYRNQCIFVWKNITDFSLLLSHVIWLPYYITRAIFSMDSAFLMGFFLAVLKLGEVVQRRMQNKVLFVKTDKEVMNSALNI